MPLRPARDAPGRRFLVALVAVVLAVAGAAGSAAYYHPALVRWVARRSLARVILSAA